MRSFCHFAWNINIQVQLIDKLLLVIHSHTSMHSQYSPILAQVRFHGVFLWAISAKINISKIVPHQI